MTMFFPPTLIATASVPWTKAAMRADAPPKRRKPFHPNKSHCRARRVAMRYCRFVLESQIHYGLVEERGNEPWIVDLAAAPDEDLGFHLARARASNLVPDPAGLDFEPMPLATSDLLPPVMPSKIICVGRNYREHAAELGNQVAAEPLLF